MTVRELAEKLHEIEPDTEVVFQVPGGGDYCSQKLPVDSVKVEPGRCGMCMQPWLSKVVLLTAV